ncbi:MAG: DUF2298 domain-containing protein [Candidatus Micrarchaeia archaeon]
MQTIPRIHAFFAFFALALLVFLGPLPALFSCIAFGFFVPGFLLLKAFRFEGNAVERLALSALGSILISSHAVYWASIAFGGYSQSSVFSAFAAISTLALFCDIKISSTGARRRDFWENARPVLAALAVFAALFLVFSQTLWVPTATGIRVGGWNWSDLFAHLPIIESVNRGNFPPQYPFFAGAPLAYHWFLDLHSAFLSKATAIPAVDFIRVENALCSAILVLLAYSLARVFLKNGKTALLAAILLLFGGSFAYVNFFQDLAKGGDALELVKNTPYDNDWKYFQVPSVLGGYMLVQRPQMIGLPGLVAVVFLFMSAFGQRRPDYPRILLAGIFAGLLAPFQFYAFASALLVAAIFFMGKVFEKAPHGDAAIKNLKALLPAGLAFALPALLLAAPFVAQAVSTTTSAGNVQMRLGWLAFDQGKLEWLHNAVPPAALPFAQAFEFPLFYAANLGMVFLMAIAALLFKPANAEKKWFLGTWMLAMFLVANTVSLSGTLWDMAKFFVYLAVPSSILAAAFLESIWEKGIIGKAGAAILVAASVLTPLLILSWTAQSQWQALSWDEVEAGKWIEGNTPQKSVFAAYFGHISPIDSVAGRFRISGYSSWMANYGLPGYQTRESDIREIFCSSAENAKTAMQKYGAQHIYLGHQERDRLPGCAFAFRESGLFEKRFYNGGIEIYALAQ